MVCNQKTGKDWIKKRHSILLYLENSDWHSSISLLSSSMGIIFMSLYYRIFNDLCSLLRMQNKIWRKNISFLNIKSKWWTTRKNEKQIVVIENDNASALSVQITKSGPLYSMKQAKSWTFSMEKAILITWSILQSLLSTAKLYKIEYCSEKLHLLEQQSARPF